MMKRELFEIRKGVEAVAAFIERCVKLKPPESAGEDIEVNVSI
jgi:hypothetical protein